jgi:hypothetical protein
VLWRMRAEQRVAWAPVSRQRQAGQFHGLLVRHDDHLELLAFSCLISSFLAPISKPAPPSSLFSIFAPPPQSSAGRICPPCSILALSISPLAPPSPHEAFALPSAAATARDRVCAIVFNLGPPPSEVSSATVGSPVQSEIILLI